MFDVDFKVTQTGDWYPGYCDGTEQGARASANKYWKAGAAEVRITEKTHRVVAHKQRSLSAENMDLLDRQLSGKIA